MAGSREVFEQLYLPRNLRLVRGDNMLCSVQDLPVGHALKDALVCSGMGVGAESRFRWPRTKSCQSASQPLADVRSYSERTAASGSAAIACERLLLGREADRRLSEIKRQLLSGADRRARREEWLELG